MKKAILISLVTLMLAASTACNAPKDNSVPSEVPSPEPTVVDIDPATITKPDKDFSMIVYRDSILGTYTKEKKWLNPTESEKLIKGDEVFTYYNFNTVPGTGIKPKIQNNGTRNIIDISRDFPYPSKSEIDSKVFLYQLGVSGNYNALPRKPIMNTANAFNNAKIVKEFLDKKGLSDSMVSIKRNVVVDLEGDGSEEQLICAYDWNTSTWRTSEGKNGKGTYSIVVLTKTINGIPVKINVASQFAKDKPEKEYIYSAPMLLDVDADAILEIVVEGKGIDSSIVEFYKIIDDKANKIYSTEIKND